MTGQQDAGQQDAGQQDDSAAARRLLRALTGTLATVSIKLEAQGHTTDEVALLVTRAATLAERARAMATLPYPAGGSFSSLTGEINAFGAEAAAVAAKATGEASQSRDLAASIRQQLEGLSALSDLTDGGADKAALREKLEGVLGALAPLSGRLHAVASLAADVSGLGERAAGMQQQRDQAGGAARAGTAAALALFSELSGFARAAGSASESLLVGNDGMRQVMSAARDRAQDMAREIGHPAPRLRAAEHAAEVPKAMVWKPRLFGRRSFS
jgi:hypothetical protein